MKIGRLRLFSFPMSQKLDSTFTERLGIKFAKFRVQF